MIIYKNLLLASVFVFVGVLFPVATMAAVPKLPVPSNGVYTLNFSYSIGQVVPGDFNGDGVLDFVMKNDIGTSETETIKVEARLNDGTKLWSFDTSITGALAGVGGFHDNIPILSWDFNNDGLWEVYIPYYNNGWRHKIVNGATGATLVDSAFPDQGYPGKKRMAAISYKGGIPRIVFNIDIWSIGRMWMFETWTGNSWSLNTLWRYDRSTGMAHDMIMAADIDQNNSDDEILAGRVVLNSNGVARYDLGRGNSDSGHLGYFSSKYSGLVYVTGDGNSGHITAVKAIDGSSLWDISVTPMFPPSTWQHFDIGLTADRDPAIPGSELLAIGKDGVSYLYIRLEDGVILDKGTTNDRWGKAPALLLWDADKYFDVRPGNICAWCGLGHGDLGGSGTEEVWLRNGKTLTIKFNMDGNSVPSRWDNRHYRQDVALFGSGYSYKYVLPLVLGSTSNPTPTPTPNPSCRIYESGNPAPAGFGQAWNVLSSAKEVLLDAQCLNSSVDIKIGTGNQNQYIYNRGYIYDGTQWQSITYSCSNLINNAWCVGDAKKTQSLTATQLAITNYYLAYVCTWTGAEWKCGCRDSACSTNYWNLQSFKK